MAIKLKDLSAHLAASRGEKIPIHHSTLISALGADHIPPMVRQGKEIPVFGFGCRAFVGIRGHLGYYIRKVGGNNG